MSDSGDTPWLVAAFYAFVSFEPGELRQRRAEWLPLAAAAGLKGTLLLAEEGLNGTLCGPETGLRGFLDQLRLDPRLADLEPKFSWSERQVFHRLKLRIKAEIVTMGRPEIQPAQRQTTDVPPQQWDDLIADPDTLVIDTRNTYEVTLGSFDGAIDPATASFRDFPAWVERDLHALVAARQPRRLALFCTGGIRCEKATAYLQQQGFEGVHQLKGGILRYLEEVPESQSRWRGECFVFDQRVALNHRLEPGSHSLCHACGLPLSLADRQQPSYVEGVSCHHCIGQFSNADCARFAERQRQISLARGRGRTTSVLQLGRWIPKPVQLRKLALLRSASMTFLGTLDELKVLVDSLDGQGHWEHKGQFEMFIFGGPDTNLRLNWWPKSGELTLVGDPAERVGVSASLQRLLAAR